MVRKLFLAKIFFTDLSDFKLRPIIIIKEYKDEDILYLPLTTNLKLNGIKINNDDLERGTLNHISIIIVPKIGILNKKFIIKEIGLVKEELFNKLMKEFCSEFNCKKIA